MIFRCIVAASALLCALVAPAIAQKTKAQINSEIAVQFPDNTQFQITPQNLRNVTGDIANSIMPTAPVVSGNLAIFDGTTGLLKDNGNVINGGALTIAPPANTLTQGLVITQSTPTSGSSATELNFNLINITDTYHTTAPGAPFSDFGLNPNNVTGFRVNHSIGGSNLGTDAHVAGLFNMRRNLSAVPTGGDALGLAATAYSNQVYGGIAGLSALDAATYIDNGAVEFYVAGIESDIGIITGGTASIRTALNLRNFGNLRGTVSDSAIWVTNQTDNAGAFQNLILLSNLNGFNPISTTGCLICADAAFTVSNVINLPTMTVTGNILNFSKAVLTGAGVLNAGGGTFDGSAGGIQTSVPSGGRVEIFSSTNTTAGVDILAAISSLTTNILTAGVLEPSFTATTFGITAGNWASINAHGSANNGLLLGTGSNSPIAIGTNDALRYTVSAAGGIFSNGVTGGDKGNGTINVAGCFVSNVACLTGISTLTFGTHLTAGGSSFNGTAGVTITSDATNANTASTIVARDGSGNFSAGTITASLTGHASLDLALTGGTMSGAIAMGGNNITGGGTAALTSLTASTSVTSPIHYGGSGAASTNIIASTSGAGTTDATIFQTGSQVEAGRINTSQQWNMGPNVTLSSGTKLTVNNSNLQVATAGLTGITAQIASATNSVNRLMMNAAGSAPVNVINFISTGGTFSVPTATQSGTILGGFGSSGFGTTIYGASSAGSGILMSSTQTFTDTAMGSNVVFSTTPNNSITNATALTINSSGGISIGASTGDPGIGAVLANTSIKSQGATGGVGYATGAGGTVTQATSKATAVTLNTVTGAITLNNAALAAATIVTFVINDSAIAATDYIGAAHESGGTTGAYTVNCRATGAGTAACDVRNNTAGSLSEAIVLRFYVGKSVNSFLLNRDLDPASNDNSPAFLENNAA